jgi:hypothetical protein
MATERSPVKGSIFGFLQDMNMKSDDQRNDAVETLILKNLSAFS